VLFRSSVLFYSPLPQRRGGKNRAVRLALTPSQPFFFPAATRLPATYLNGRELLHARYLSAYLPYPTNYSQNQSESLFACLLARRRQPPTRRQEVISHIALVAAIRRKRSDCSQLCSKFIGGINLLCYCLRAHATVTPISSLVEFPWSFIRPLFPRCRSKHWRLARIRLIVRMKNRAWPMGLQPLAITFFMPLSLPRGTAHLFSAQQAK